jgi:hypothetical protein
MTMNTKILYGKLNSFMGTMRDCTARKMVEGQQVLVVERIVNCAVWESALTDGKPDAAKMRPICFDPCQHVYRLMGETVAKAFSCGKALKG